MFTYMVLSPKPKRSFLASTYPCRPRSTSLMTSEKGRSIGTRTMLATDTSPLIPEAQK